MCALSVAGMHTECERNWGDRAPIPARARIERLADSAAAWLACLRTCLAFARAGWVGLLAGRIPLMCALDRTAATDPPACRSNGDVEEEDCVCLVCGDSEKEARVMLECDRCLAGCHLGCLSPPLQEVPEVRPSSS